MPNNNNLFRFDILNSETGVDAGDFSLSPEDMAVDCPITIHAKQTTLAGGKQQGVKLITLTVGDLTVRVVPARGMAILDATYAGTAFGWSSPVKEIVHPGFINLESSGGLGWLDGFNEMIARCGYQWTGHPGQDGDEFLTLHGRIQNTPATKVSLSIEREPPYRITLSGRVDEKRFKFANFEVWMHLSILPGDPYLYIDDTLTNKGPYRREYQVIYHNNFGPPILEPGSKMHVPAAEISPFNNHAAGGLGDWNQVPEPTRNYDEMVFNLRPLSDDRGNTLSLLHNSAADKGIEVVCKVDNLPVLTVWKNTDLAEQGYVMGIEPGTSFAYNRRYQRALGLVPWIEAGESRSFSLRFGLLTTPELVAASVARIQAIQGDNSPEINPIPLVKLEK